MLEKMGEFFDARLEDYEAHQLECIEAAREFYPYTASLLPGGKILDLGCGTGLELDFYFRDHPGADVTGIDLAPGMLRVLREKYPGMTLIEGSCFDVDLGRECFDAALSVESLHHFTAEEKLPLYRRLRDSLKPGGFFILTDYFSLSEEEELAHRAEYLRLKAEQDLPEGEFYHYDTPLTAAHEMETLRRAGFSHVEVLKRWGATYCLRAER